MTYEQAKEGLKRMLYTGVGWIKLETGKIATRRDCKRFIKLSNMRSPEDNFEKLRRNV